ncbi:low-density lipoprotein receptor-related protein 11 isoform X2 [Loxodonta africana]|uniref:low-density lipoprotein receptor-related protein 11 isoform X2 n=1 Tax=Loxodonta africana TaxID=9785 RepID=UPI0030CC593C
MASAAGESAGSGRRRPPRPRALRGLLLLCLWLPSGRAEGPPATPLSGVEQLLQEFRRQLRQEPAQEELELELRAGSGPRESCPGAGGGGYRAMPDAIIRTKDSLAAGASFLRAPAAVWGWRQCVAACCAEPRCSVAVVELPRRPASAPAALGCYLFNCTARGRSVCKFAPHRGYSSYSLSRAAQAEPGALTAGAPAAAAAAAASPPLDNDEPPLSKAGQDVVVYLPTEGVMLDGRESTDDHAIVQYEWTLLRGDPSVDMKVPHSGTLKLSHLQEGTYTFQLTVTDTAGQRSSDNISVTVLPMAYSTEVNFGHKMVTHTAASPAQPRTIGLSEDMGGHALLEMDQKATTQNQPPTLSTTEKKNHSTSRGPGSQVGPVLPGGSSSGNNQKEETFSFESKSDRRGGEHPAPETGAVLPLALGLAITALLLLMVVCRLRLVKQKLKKARPITSEESDYLINGMYL